MIGKKEKTKTPGFNLLLKDYKPHKINLINKSNTNNNPKNKNKIIELKINLETKEAYFNENDNNNEDSISNNDKFLISNILNSDNSNSIENKSDKNTIEDILIKEKEINKNNINFEKINNKGNLFNSQYKSITKNRTNKKYNLKINNKEIVNKDSFIKKKTKNKYYDKSKRFNSMNYIYNIDRDIFDYNNIDEIKNNSLILKLKYNSNNTSIQSINIEEEENKTKKFNKKEKIFVKPILSNCLITKSINKIFQLLYSVKNQNYFCTKENYISHLMNFKKDNYIPINITNIKNKKENKIYTKLKISLKNPILSKYISLTPIAKYNNKRIDFSNNNKILSKPKKSIKDYMIKKVIKRYKIDFNNKNNKNQIFSNSGRLLNKNENNKEIPLLKICYINGDIIKINLDKNKNIIMKDENYIQKNIKAKIKYKENIKNCPLCLKKKDNFLKKQNNLLTNIQNKLNNTFNVHLEKEEIKKITKANNKDNKEIKYIIKDYSNFNRRNNNNPNKKIVYNYSKNFNNNLNKKENLIDSLNSNDLNISNNYTHLINIEFPAINSYFHKNINKKNK